MKYTIKVSTLIIISTLLGFMSCEKEIPYGHPTCDTCDWDVMTCKVDGVSWQARKKCELLSNCDPVECDYFPPTGALRIVGSNDLIGMQFSSIFSGINNEMPYIFKNDFFSKSNSASNCIRYSLDTTTNLSFIIIQLDTITQIIEGKFEFTALNKCSSKVLIKEGYFKLTYKRQ